MPVQMDCFVPVSIVHWNEVVTQNTSFRSPIGKRNTDIIIVLNGGKRISGRGITKKLIMIAFNQNDLPV